MRRFSRLQIFLLSLLCASCTIEQQSADTQAEFHPPFTYTEWTTQQLASGQGGTACVVSSGHNGLAFVVRHAGGQRVVSVQSNRASPTGTWITVTVNGHRYETSQPYFSANDAVAMAEDFSVADKAFAEWSELRGYNGRVRYSNVYKLAGFKVKFQACSK